MVGGTVFEKMDRMYRHQKYFFDISRKYYLLGRDSLLDLMEIEPGANVLEVGCGTGRNLEMLARRCPDASFFGIDASAEMLSVAAKRKGLRGPGKVILARALAEEFGPDGGFGPGRPFDVIFFSYSISMMSEWEKALANALANLSASGALYVVDFYDQRDLPGWFQRAVRTWLGWFSVEFKNGLVPALERLTLTGGGELEVTPLYKSYSFMLRYSRQGNGAFQSTREEKSNLPAASGAANSSFLR